MTTELMIGIKSKKVWICENKTYKFSVIAIDMFTGFGDNFC